MADRQPRRSSHLAGFSLFVHLEDPPKSIVRSGKNDGPVGSVHISAIYLLAESWQISQLAAGGPSADDMDGLSIDYAEAAGPLISADLARPPR